MMVWLSVARVGTGTTSTVSLEQFPPCRRRTMELFQVIVVFLPKGAITEVILVYEYLHGDAKFSREFCMGIPNSSGNFAWGCQIPFLLGDARFPVCWGIPKTLKGFHNP